jgi:hypothetical protein
MGEAEGEGDGEGEKTGRKDRRGVHGKGLEEGKTTAASLSELCLSVVLVKRIKKSPSISVT